MASDATQVAFRGLRVDPRDLRCGECREKGGRHAQYCPNRPRVPACATCGKRGVHHDRCPERPAP